MLFMLFCNQNTKSVGYLMQGLFEWCWAHKSTHTLSLSLNASKGHYFTHHTLYQGDCGDSLFCFLFRCCIHSFKPLQKPLKPHPSWALSPQAPRPARASSGSLPPSPAPSILLLLLQEVVEIFRESFLQAEAFACLVNWDLKMRKDFAGSEERSLLKNLQTSHSGQIL